MSAPMQARATELWFWEDQTPDLALGFRVTRTLAHERTPYQELLLVETASFGRLLALDGAVQLTERDEFFYHEMLAHVPLCAVGDPRRVLVVGGGDGGTVREVLRHPTVEQVDLVEIDARVTELARQHLPSLASCLDDARVRVIHGDGVAYLRDVPGATYDAILVDSTDPIGAAEGLFSQAFYELAAKALRPSGVLACQTESPLLHLDLLAGTVRRLRKVLPQVHVYLAPVPTYPSGLWSFVAASPTTDPSQPHPEAGVEGTRYYSPQVHRAAFVLPPFVVGALEEGEGR